MIFLHLVYSLWVLLLIPLINAVEFTPKVTKTLSENSFNILSFDDSNTLIRTQGNSMTISFNDGETWEKIKELEDRVGWAMIDQFNRHDRAIVAAEKGEIVYITEDQGKSWRPVTITDSKEDDSSTHCYMSTHPTKKEYFLAYCSYCKSEEVAVEDVTIMDRSLLTFNSSVCMDRVFASNDGCLLYTSRCV